MAYLIHYRDERLPNVIKEEIVLIDYKPDDAEIEDFRPVNHDEVTVHNISDEDWPGALPLDRCLKPSFQ